MQEIVLATHNQGKFTELQAILAPIHCIAQHSLGITSIEETGLSFIENAINKARFASKLANKPALADDSGLVVPALNGQPGIYSARFAGINATDEENIQLLLNKLKNIEQRNAYFYCALALITHHDNPTPFITTGTLQGVISRKPHGNSGFGYDPIFFLPDFQCTMGELPLATKNTISHRAQALQELRKQLRSLDIGIY